MTGARLQRVTLYNPIGAFYLTPALSEREAVDCADGLIYETKKILSYLVT